MYKRYRNQLINNLKFNTYCRIGLSKICGVGVIAIKPIDINIDPFQTVFKLDTTSLCLSENEVESLDPGIVQLIKDFFMKTSDGNYPVYYNGLNSMDIAYYLNHSDNPNVMMVYEPYDRNQSQGQDQDQDQDQNSLSTLDNQAFYSPTDKNMDINYNQTKEEELSEGQEEREKEKEEEEEEETGYYTFKTIK
ncbi:MAG: hypothetical protein WD512_06605, partial [Candidatus Paceibacterota bacterium]